MMENQAKFCSQCGASIVDGAPFCAQCGTPVSAGSPPTGPQTNRTVIIVVAICAAVAVIGLVIWALTRGGATTPLGETSNPPSTPSAAVSSPSAVPNGTARVNLKITGCGDCTVTANGIALATNNATPWTSGPRKETGGVVTFDVPVAQSKGLSFDVSSPRETAADAVAVAVVQYMDYSAGQTITQQQAQQSTQGFGCWAGTSDVEVTLDLTVAFVKSRGIAGPGEAILAYFNPGQEIYGDPHETFGGRLGHQNMWFCNA